jgi:5-methylthioadenosine/S-adenosylhomocysteine deaminase
VVERRETMAGAIQMAMVITGRTVTFDPSRPHLSEGAVYVSDDGLIEAVRDVTDQAPAGYESAARVASGGLLYPGLMDLHNHLAYNFHSLWMPPRPEPYTRRDQWQQAASYQTDVKAPANVIGAAAPKAMLKYAEVKALVGGATAIQGSAKLSRPYEGWLIRNVEYEKFGGEDQLVYQSVITLDGAELDDRSQKMQEGRAFVYHLCEGTTPDILDEYRDVRDHGCLQPRFLAIHATALSQTEYAEWSPHGGSIVWSPLSNLWLYAGTTDVAAAAGNGIRVCLGADWGPSGSKNILGELKVADICNRELFDGVFSDQELCKMATMNPAAALGWDDRLGALKTGALADLIVLGERSEDPYRNLIDATERDVWLVIVGGRPVYGRPHLMRLARAHSPEPIYVSGIRRSIAMVDPSVPDADMSWAQVRAELDAVEADPVGLVEASLGVGEEDALRLIPDMPGDDIRPMDAALSLAGARIEIDTLHHDARFFERLERGPILGGRLEGMRRYYLG